MAKDRKKLLHIHSSIPDKQPTAASLEVGEIAVNNAANQEFLSIKNSEDKVKRFSSDEQMITWMERKEVMPYKGYVKGRTGNSTYGENPGSGDTYGSYGITNADLLENKSQIIVKLNQVAAKNTGKYNQVNNAKDKYGNIINPWSGETIGDGAGFYIDMSRYAMNGANPSFSSLTVTDKSDLSGNTTIANGDGTGTRNGHTLAIKTTDVTANDTNWTEIITNKKSTVTAEEDKIGTLNESATTRTTTVGTENLTVSGITTEVHTGNVIITNLANVTATTNGTTTETKVGNVTENNSTNKQENTAGTHKLYTTGDTCINSQANANFYGKGSTNIGVACDGTKGSATTVYGTTTTISGNTTNVTGATTLNLSGNTINERALTANTNVTSAYTSATTATTVIGTANTSATTATLSGNTLDITEVTRLSAKTPSTYVSGTTLDIKENNTDIESCGRISGKTNAFTIQECAAGNGKTVINQTDIKASGKTLSFDETTSISAKTPTTTLSGTNLNVTETTSTINSTNTNLTGTNLSISETNTTINSCGKIEVTTDKYTLKQCSTSGGSAEFEFCNGYTVKSNAINLQQCGTAGTISITAQTHNINGGNLTIRESGATDFSGNTLTTTTASNANINVKGNLTEVVTGTTNETHSGAVTITNGSTKTETTTGAVTENNKAGYTANTTGDTCLQSTADMNVGGAANTNIGTNCDDSVKANYVNVKAKSGITETANTVTISGTTSAAISGATVNVSGNTTNISGATNLNMSGKTVNVDATDIDVDASNNYCLSAATKANIYGKATNIGIECGGTTATSVNVSGTTINEGGTTLNQNFQDYDINASKSYCVSAATNANFYGKTTNVGVDCGGTTATTINVSGTTINEGGTTNNNNFTTINNTAATINNKANFNITGTTYISGNTTISGDVTIGDELIIPIPCDSISSTTVNKALCEILDRGVVTIEKNTNPSDTRLATVYTIKQNGSTINTIEVAKDQFLQNAEVVKNTSGEWVIRLTWWIYDPDSGTHTTATTDIAASELVKDLTAANPSDNGTALNHNVSVNAWYDSTSGDMKFSAETTQNMHVGNMYVTGTTSASTVSGTNVNGGTISGTTVKGVSISGTNITASDAIRANNVSANTLTAATSVTTKDLAVTGNETVEGTLNVSGASTINGVLTIPSGISKKLNWAAGAFTADTTGYNGSADKVITVPTCVSHLNRKKLKITHNGNGDASYDPGSACDNTELTIALTHKKLTATYEATSGKSGSVTYNTSEDTNISIPTKVSHLTNDLKDLTIAYGSSSNKTGTSTYNGSAAVGTLYIPNTLSNVSNGVVSDSNAASTTAGEVKITKNVSVTGTITASGAIYSSDRNLKDNIVDIDDNELDKAASVSFKSYNFKGENNKIYGVIAQDLQEIGLNEMVYTKDDGTLAVDYTSLMILEIAKLRRDENSLLEHIAWLERRIEKLESEKKD